MKGIKISTSVAEIRHISMAIIGISLAFAIASTKDIFTLSFLSNFLVAFLTVGIGFVFHELAHKIVAQRFGCAAEFRAFGLMLLIGIFFAFSGFVFIAPGAVLISGYIDRRQNGIISSAGIAANIAVAGFFFVMMLVFGSTGLSHLFYYGARINALLAVFNLLPFASFDGRKVLAWSKLAYAGLMILGGILFLLIDLLSQASAAL